MENTPSNNKASSGTSALDAGLERGMFERWVLDTPYFGYESGDGTAIDRDGDGYEDATVHAAWLGYKLRYDVLAILPSNAAHKRQTKEE